MNLTKRIPDKRDYVESAILVWFCLLSEIRE